MPWGLMVLGGFSLLVFRRARRAGRNPFGWVLILWAAVFGLGVVAAYVGYAGVPVYEGGTRLSGRTPG